MKTMKSVRVLVVAGALGLLSSYVVYSQRQHAQNVISGSNSGVVDMVPDYFGTAQTNTLRRSLQVAAPDFKGPVQSLAPASKGQPSASAEGKRLMIAPGSKSAAVFDLPRATEKTAETKRAGLSRVPPPSSGQMAKATSLSETNRNTAAQVQSMHRTQQNTNVSHP
jgi:hypothetical protein